MEDDTIGTGVLEGDADEPEHEDLSEEAVA